MGGGRERERERKKERREMIPPPSPLAGADPNVRDYGGRRPIDILSNKANERAKSKRSDDHYHIASKTFTI